MSVVYILVSGQQRGPFTFDQLRPMARAGVVKKSDLFWQEGMSEWKPLASIWRKVIGQKALGAGAIIVLAICSAYACLIAWWALAPKPPPLPEKPAVQEKTRTREAVYNDSTGGVSQVRIWLRNNVKDPRSLEFINWSPVQKSGDGFMVRVKYRARNSFGGYVVEEKVFSMDREGRVTDVVDW